MISEHLNSQNIEHRLQYRRQQQCCSAHPVSNLNKYKHCARNSNKYIACIGYGICRLRLFADSTEQRRWTIVQCHAFVDSFFSFDIPNLFENTKTNASSNFESKISITESVQSLWTSELERTEIVKIDNRFDAFHVA